MSDHDDEPPATPGNRMSTVAVRRFRLRIVAGGEVGHVFESKGARVQLGSDPLNDLMLDEGTISPFHCEIFDDQGIPWVRDLGSRHGTVVDGVRVREAALRSGSLLQLGRISLRIELFVEMNRIPVSEQKGLGRSTGLDREFIYDAAAEVVLQLVVDGSIMVSPVSVAAVEREVATATLKALRQEPPRFETVGRRRDTPQGGPSFESAGLREGRPSVVEGIIRALRASSSVGRVLADDATLVRKILSVIALLSAGRGSPQSFGGMGSPPPSSGSPGGCPAEVRAWEVRHGETPSEPDPERRQRGKKRWKR